MKRAAAVLVLVSLCRSGTAYIARAIALLGMFGAEAAIEFHQSAAKRLMSNSPIQMSLVKLTTKPRKPKPNSQPPKKYTKRTCNVTSDQLTGHCWAPTRRPGPLH